MPRALRTRADARPSSAPLAADQDALLIALCWEFETSHAAFLDAEAVGADVVAMEHRLHALLRLICTTPVHSVEGLRAKADAFARHYSSARAFEETVAEDIVQARIDDAMPLALVVDLRQVFNLMSAAGDVLAAKPSLAARKVAWG